jgi:hypothetical protein
VEFSDNPITLIDQESRSGISARISIPARTQPTVQDLTFIATHVENGSVASVFVRLTLSFGTPTPTSELPPGCPEVNDPGGDFKNAALIRVNLEESHGICKTGDEDWFKFAGVADKVYTIDIPSMDNGLDLALQLFDDKKVFLTGNDDFTTRGPTPVPDDMKPRIQSWRAPRSGYFYIRVFDTLGVGGANLGYKIIVKGESYGPVPSTVPEVCNDQWEQDGLPEIAKLIMSNETQRGHALCPDGDADWVRFFALAGRTYIIATDTRPYQNGDQPEPGADTTLLLVNRDGATAIDFNNDIAGGNTLDSQIEFRPLADGFYYAQVKNVGEIGTMFIRYDLSVKVCTNVPCAGVRGAAAVRLNWAPVFAEAATPTATVTPTATPTAK